MTSLKRFAFLAAMGLPLALGVPAALSAQQAPEVTDARLEVYARAFIDVSKVQDVFDPQLAAARNKTPEAQVLLREQRREAVVKALEVHSLTEQEYNRITFVVSSNQERREAFDRILEAAKAGTPTP